MEIIIITENREYFQDEPSFMKYLHTHTAQPNNLEVKKVGLHSPQRAKARLRTPTAEEKTIYLC